MIAEIIVMAFKVFCMAGFGIQGLMDFSENKQRRGTRNLIFSLLILIHIAVNITKKFV